MEKKDLASSDPSWRVQKLRMDDMIAKLKTEIKEVKSIDKNLTRQFIMLGGKINKLKISQDNDDDEFYIQAETGCIAKDQEIGIIVANGDLSIDTKL